MARDRASRALSNPFRGVDIFNLFYLFLNVFANIDAKKIFIDKVFKTLIKIVAIYIFVNLSIVLTRIKIQF